MLKMNKIKMERGGATEGEKNTEQKVKQTFIRTYETPQSSRIEEGVSDIKQLYSNTCSVIIAVSHFAIIGFFTY